jgi:pimeloyl-ACP methyl ester carboxylesterase
VAKPLVVLLHGVGLDHTMWRPVTALLHDEFEVLTPDLLGHGKNEPARDGVTLRELADDVAAALPGSAHLVGFSLGALVAQHLARHRPDLVASLTSVNSVCRRTESERTAVLGRLAVAEADFPASVEASLKRWYDGTGTDPELVAETRATLLANDLASYLNCYRVFATGDAEIGPELPQITTPALAITGELDPGSTPEMTRRLAAALPDCRAVIVPDARHMLPVQRPRELVTPLTTFIRERGNA